MIDYFTLKLIWWILVGVLLIGFAIMDGHDMGVGTLLPFLGKDDTDRRVMINSVAPHWDGNQVWFITAGGAIFAAWPFVYATAFSGMYWALLLVLFALHLEQQNLADQQQAQLQQQASLLAAVLPSPRKWSASHPSSYVARRASWIRQQMRQLGGSSYLSLLDSRRAAPWNQ